MRKVGNSMEKQQIDYEAVKAKQHATWATGNFAIVGSRTMLAGEILCESAGVRPNNDVLDIACGAGTAALAAARRFANVTGIDYVASLIELANSQAEVEHLDATFQVGDAESLDFPDAHFDVVLSMFGIMFAPNQTRAAAELLRVCKTGGTIGLISWTPEGFLGQLIALNAQHLPVPPGLDAPTRWGTEIGIQALLGNGITDIRNTPRSIIWRFRSPAHWVDFYRTYFGPVAVAFSFLDEKGKASYESELLNLIDRYNTPSDGTVSISAEYLETIATRR